MGPPPMFFIFPFLFPLAAVVFFGWLGLRFVRAKEQANQLPGASRGELSRIEETLETLARDVQALQERQTFVEKLLERPREPAPPIAPAAPAVPSAPRAPSDPHL